MPTAAETLASFAAGLQLEDIPPAAVERIKDDMIDTMAAILFGAGLPWSRMAADYARQDGGDGPCTILGAEGARCSAPYAAFANGVAAHAFEMDGTRDPAVGAHGGATLLPVVLAACQEADADGQTAVVAYTAGCESLYRIAASVHGCEATPEHLGFHNVGVLGPFAGAIAAGRVYRLNAEEMTNALGIAGSLLSGLLAFTKAEKGGMVKRLHAGRANEAGILAARLAKLGYKGPENVFEAKFGFLNVYARGADPAKLTAKLGEEWEAYRIGMKRYPFHMLAQTPVQSLQELRAEHRFEATDIEKIVVEADAKTVSHNNIRDPRDMAQAQYSTPFCVAMSMHRDPEDPHSFDNVLEDGAIRETLNKIQILELVGRKSRKSSRVTVHLKDGRVVMRATDTFKGMPSDPMSRADLHRKLSRSAGRDAEAVDGLFRTLETLECQDRFTVAGF